MEAQGDGGWDLIFFFSNSRSKNRKMGLGAVPIRRCGNLQGLRHPIPSPESSGQYQQSWKR